MGEKGEARNGINITSQETFTVNKQPFSICKNVMLSSIPVDENEVLRGYSKTENKKPLTS